MTEGPLPRRAVPCPTPCFLRLVYNKQINTPYPHPRLSCERGSRDVILSASSLVMFHLPKMQKVCTGLLLSRPLCVYMCVCDGGGCGVLELVFHFIHSLTPQMLPPPHSPPPPQIFFAPAASLPEPFSFAS